MNRSRIAMIPLGVLVACVPDVELEPCASDTVPPVTLGPAIVDGPCDLDVAAPTKLLVTTTDFATGAVTIVDLATMAITTDVALGSTDAIPSFHDGMGVLVHRYQIDGVQVLDPTRDWATAADVPITATCSDTPNPQSIAFAGDGRGYVAQLDVPEIAILDLHAPAAEARVGTIDMRAVPDLDGNPDLGAAVACGSIVWVVAQRLDPSYARLGPDELIAVDTIAGAPIDLDPTIDGAQGLRSAGTWLRQLRRDPTDADAHTLLGLSTGIERFDLAAGTVEWLVTPDQFAASGLVGALQAQAFAIDGAGELAYVAAYDDDFTQVQLYRVALGDGEPRNPEPFADGFDSVERTLEHIDDRLWYGSTRRTAPGLWVFDTSGEVPEPIAGPLPTGLPPYSMVAIP